MTRRQALRFGAVAAGAAGLDVHGAAVAKVSAVAGRERERSFDDGWLFLRGDATGAEAPAFDDSSWRTLDLPHDGTIEDLPYATSDDDGGATSFPSLLVPEEPDPAWPAPPDAIGPFDPGRSQNGGSIGYTVGGTGWYRKHFEVAEPADGRESHMELRFDGV
ncbi:hypothetical protein [Streptomyces adelaidensis]|uniref:hypothetical protein n=1 Tax=Streptomyces adelaidensis TaxID=2796465 RepID=UPI001902CDA0|nr:hypothetical protein [Streptomyces adelaidensis]